MGMYIRWLGFLASLSLSFLILGSVPVFARGTVIHSSTLPSYYVIVAYNYTAAGSPSCYYTGNGTAVSCSGYFAAGTAITAAAAVDGGFCGSPLYTFIAWNGVGSGSYSGSGAYRDCASTAKFVVASNIIETAHYIA